jgi:VanZ family protein
MTPGSGDLSPLKFARLWFALAYALLAIVALASLLPVPDMGTSDKLLHLLTYTVLSAVFSTLVCRNISLLKVVPGLILFGILLEFLQGLTGYRYLEVNDMLANSVGVFAGLVVRLTPIPLWFRRLERLVF